MVWVGLWLIKGNSVKNWRYVGYVPKQNGSYGNLYCKTKYDTEV